MLDVGVHCKFCRQLDFLPFKCSSCGFEYCADHRSRDAHRCTGIEESKKDEIKPQKDHNGKYFNTLLPAPGYQRVNSPQKATQGDQRLGSGPVVHRVKDRVDKHALEKLKRFFKRTGKPKSISSSTSEVLQIKKQAKGSDKFPISNRVYIWVINLESKTGEERTAMYVNKIWPIGRALDDIAQQLHVTNTNSSHLTDSQGKLYLYKHDDTSDQFELLENTTRVSQSIREMDTIYLVRGSPPIH